MDNPNIFKQYMINVWQRKLAEEKAKEEPRRFWLKEYQSRINKLTSELEAQDG